MVVCVKSYCSPKSSCIPPLVRPVTLSAHPVWLSIPNKSGVCSSIKTPTLLLLLNKKKIIASCSKSPKDDLDLDLDLDNIILDLERACQLVVEQVDPPPEDLFHTMSINYSFKIDSCDFFQGVRLTNVDDRYKNSERIKNLSEDLEALNSPNASRAAHLINTISTKIWDAESSCHASLTDYYQLQLLTIYKRLWLLDESLLDVELVHVEWPKDDKAKELALQKFGPRMTLNDMIREWPTGGDDFGLRECDFILSDIEKIYMSNLKNQMMLKFAIIPLFETCVASLIKYLVR